jgi:hypothetical protein
VRHAEAARARQSATRTGGQRIRCYGAARAGRWGPAPARLHGPQLPGQLLAVGREPRRPLLRGRQLGQRRLQLPLQRRGLGGGSRWQVQGASEHACAKRRRSRSAFSRRGKRRAPGQRPWRPPRPPPLCGLPRRAAARRRHPGQTAAPRRARRPPPRRALRGPRLSGAARRRRAGPRPWWVHQGTGRQRAERMAESEDGWSCGV